MKKISILVLASAIFLFPIQQTFSEEDTAGSDFIVDSIRYEVDGTTKVKALSYYSDLEAGMSFPSLEELSSYVDNERQKLINRRYFDSVETSIIKLPGSDGKEHYEVLFQIVDAFTFIPVPYPKYDSNTGFRLGLKLYWDNFLGSMTDAYLGMRMDIRKNSETGKLEVGEWGINPSISGIKVNEILYMSAGLSQSFNEEDFIDTVVPSNSYDYSYYASSGSVSAGLRLNKKGARVYKSYSFGLSSEFRYDYKGDLGPLFEQPWTITPSHGFGIGRVDWINNFRKGFSAGISNAYRMGYNENFFLITDVTATAKYYFPFWKRFNLYTRAQTFYQWGEIRNIGSQIRGVKDNLVSGYTGLVLNTSLAFQFWRFEKVWDAQIHPFVDIAIVYNNEGFVSERDFNVGIGADLVLYLDALPSLVAVGSIGIDAMRLDMDNISDSLEISITSKLFY